MEISKLFDLQHTLAGEYLAGFQYPWEALKGIKNLILALGETLGEEYEQVQPQVWVHKTAKVFPSAYLGAPCIIGAGSEVRHCAFIRGSALVGEGCVVGNSTELKNVILFDGVQVPHYNYVGDSILGYKAHMGAGSITSNVKSDKSLVVIHGERDIPTGIKNTVAQTYNSTLRTLGEEDADFLAAVCDLTDAGCRALDAQMPTPEDVYCQSVGSVMKKAAGGQFPLNFSYHLVNHFSGENDGLVSTESPMEI